MRKTLCVVSCLAFLSASLGCATAIIVPGGAALEDAPPSTVTIPRGAWIGVAIEDPAAKDTGEIRQELTLSIESYAQKGGHFSRVNALPGEPSSEDYTLSFVFDRYNLVRERHEASIFLGGALYMLLGGPMYRDSAEVAAALTVTDASGKVLFLGAEQGKDVHNSTMYTGDSTFATGMKVRTKVVRALLDQAVAELSRTAEAATH